jgi:RimJ/RimL family protein N-acetyltransferase
LGNAHTLQATIAETNTASRRSAERAGFQLIGKSDETCPNGDNQEHGLTYQLSI